MGNAAALKVLNPILAYEMGLGDSFADWALQLQATSDPTAQQALRMFDDMRDKHPLAFTLGDATGQIAQAALLEGPVFGALGKGLPITSKLVKGAVSGGLSNALVGAVHDVSLGKDADEVAMNLLTNAAFGSLGDTGLRMGGDLAGSYVPKAGTALYEKMLQNGGLIRRLRPAAEPLSNAFAQSARRLAGDALPAEEAANASRFSPRAEALETAKDAANKAANLADEIPREYTWSEGIGTSEPDVVIGKSLGAKAKNYDVLAPNGDILQLTEGTRITNVETIAGQGRVRQIDIVDKLVDTYGGHHTTWKKCKGYGYVDIDGESYLAELHWYEDPATGRVAFKIKKQPGGEWFINED